MRSLSGFAITIESELARRTEYRGPNEEPLPIQFGGSGAGLLRGVKFLTPYPWKWDVGYANFFWFMRKLVDRALGRKHARYEIPLDVRAYGRGEKIARRSRKKIPNKLHPREEIVPDLDLAVL